MQALWDAAISGFEVAKPFLAALVLVVGLVLIGDRGSRSALKRNNQCLAALCVFVFALGSGMATWFLIMQPLFLQYGAAFTISYPLVLMYWAFWLLVGVLISAKMMLWDSVRRQGQLP